MPEETPSMPAEPLRRIRTEHSFDLEGLVERLNQLLPSGDPRWTPGTFIAVERRLMPLSNYHVPYVATALGVDEIQVRNSTVTPSDCGDDEHYKIKTTSIESTRKVLEHLGTDVIVYLVNENLGTIATGPIPPHYQSFLQKIGARILPDAAFGLD